MKITFDLNDKEESLNVLGLIRQRHLAILETEPPAKITTPEERYKELRKRTKGGTWDLIYVLFHNYPTPMTTEEMANQTGVAADKWWCKIANLGKVEKTYGKILIKHKAKGDLTRYSIHPVVHGLLLDQLDVFLKSPLAPALYHPS